MDRLREAHSRATREEGKNIAVLFLDLDDFKSVNEALGYQAGDRALSAVAERVEGCLREEDTAARWGGDEFMVLLDGIGGAEEATLTAEKILEVLRKPLVVGEAEPYLTASIGVALNTPASRNEQPRDLLRSAELSMYRSKSEGKASYTVFDSGG